MTESVHPRRPLRLNDCSNVSALRNAGSDCVSRPISPPSVRIFGMMAEEGLKAGAVQDRTDDIGFHAVENRRYVTDVHATALHRLGIDPKRLGLPGRKRLEIDRGKPIREIIA